MSREPLEYPLSTIGDRLEGLIDRYYRVASLVKDNQKVRDIAMKREPTPNDPQLYELRHQYSEPERIYDEMTAELATQGYNKIHDGLMHECYLRQPTKGLPLNTVFIRRKQKHADPDEPIFASALVPTKDIAERLSKEYCHALRTPHLNTKLLRDKTLHTAGIIGAMGIGVAAAVTPLFGLIIPYISDNDPSARAAAWAYWACLPLVGYAAGRSAYKVFDELVGTGRFRRAVAAWNKSEYPSMVRHHERIVDPLWDTRRPSIYTSYDE